jgi:hypothetical protein
VSRAGDREADLGPGQRALRSGCRCPRRRSRLRGGGSLAASGVEPFAKSHHTLVLTGRPEVSSRTPLLFTLNGLTIGFDLTFVAYLDALQLTLRAIVVLFIRLL